MYSTQRYTQLNIKLTRNIRLHVNIGGIGVIEVICPTNVQCHLAEEIHPANRVHIHLADHSLNKQRFSA